MSGAGGSDVCCSRADPESIPSYSVYSLSSPLFAAGWCQTSIGDGIVRAGKELGSLSHCGKRLIQSVLSAFYFAQWEINLHCVRAPGIWSCFLDQLACPAWYIQTLTPLSFVNIHYPSTHLGGRWLTVHLTWGKVLNWWNDKVPFVPEIFYLVTSEATGLVSYCESHCVRLSATCFGGKEKGVGFQFRCNDTQCHTYCIYPVARYA